MDIRRLISVTVFILIVFLTLMGRNTAFGETDTQDADMDYFLTTGARLMPTFIVVRIAGGMDPADVARLSINLPVEKAVDVTEGLDRDFVADVTRHLDPVKGAPVIEQCPDELVVDIINRLLGSGDAKTVGRLADHLSRKKLIRLSKQLTIPNNIQVAHHMSQRKLIATVIAVYPDTYLIALMQGCVRLGYYDLIADVAQEMDSARMVHILLNKLEMDENEKVTFLTGLSRFLRPEKSAEIICQCPDNLIARVVGHMIQAGDAEIAGKFSDHLPLSKLKSVSTHLTSSEITQVGDHMTDKAMAAMVMSDTLDDQKKSSDPPTPRSIH